MCIPALNTMAAVATAAGALSGAGQRAAQARAQARFASEEAASERRRGTVDAARQRRAGRRAFGERLAQFARDGVSLEGSPATILADLAADNALDEARVRRGAQTRETRQRFAAALDRSRAGAARTQGLFAALSPIIRSLR